MGWLRWPYGLMSQLPLRRSISTRRSICTLSNVQICASDRASACGKSKQRRLLRVDKISLLFFALTDIHTCDCVCSPPAITPKYAW